MKGREIRELTTDELQKKASDLKVELFNLRFQLATGQLDNPMRVREVKKSLARVKTIIRERDLEADLKAGSL